MSISVALTVDQIEQFEFDMKVRYIIELFVEKYSENWVECELKRSVDFLIKNGEAREDATKKVIHSIKLNLSLLNDKSFSKRALSGIDIEKAISGFKYYLRLAERELQK